MPCIEDFDMEKKFFTTFGTKITFYYSFKFRVEIKCSYYFLTYVSDSISLSSPPGNQSPKEFDKMFETNVSQVVLSLSENLQHLIMGRISQAKTSLRSMKIVIYVCAADSQGKFFLLIACFLI